MELDKNQIQIQEDNKSDQFQIGANVSKKLAIQTNNFIINKYTYPSSQLNSIRVFLIFMIRYFFIINNIFTFIAISIKSQNQQNFSRILIQFFNRNLLLFQNLSIIQNLLALFIILYLQTNTNDPKLTNSKIIQTLQYLIQLNLHFSAIPILINFYQGLPLIIIASIIAIYSSIHFTNYYMRTDYLYHSSMTSNLIFYILIITEYFLNGISLNIKSFHLFTIMTMVMTVSLWIWYFSSGYILFIYPISRYCLKIFISLSMISSLICLQKYMIEQYLIQNELASILIIFTCSFYVVDSLHNKFFERLIMSVQQITPQNIMKIDLLISILKNEQRTQQNYCILIGLIKFYQIEAAKQNTHINIYDPISRIYVSRVSTTIINCDIIVKNTIRQMYNQYKIQHPGYLLKYMQFLINEYPIQSIISKLSSNVLKRQLNQLQRIQLSKIVYNLQMKVGRLNKNILDGCVDFENLLISQNIFDNICLKLREYIHINIQLWDILSKNKLNIGLIRKLFITAYRLVKEMDCSWAYLNQYFNTNQRWRYLYIIYNLYIKNIKLKQRQRDEIQQYNRNNNIFYRQKIYIEQNISDQRIINNKKLLFDLQTFTIHVTMQHSQLFIKNVSQYFTNNLCYKKQQIIGVNLNILLDDNLKLIHIGKVLQWLNMGYEINEQQYKIKYTYCLNKQGRCLPIIKLFKTFINYTTNQFEYISLVKINNRLNNKREIEIQNKQQDYQQQQSKIKDIINNNQNMYNYEQNIFIKDDYYLPVQQIKQLKDIKLIVRLFTISISLTVIILAFINNEGSNTLILYSLEYINFMQIYRLPMILANDYYKSILNIGNRQTLRKHILSNTQYLRQISSNQLTIKTIFDKVINQPFIYYPLSSNTFNKNQSYNQIQLYFFIHSTISTISSSDIIDPNSHDFHLFHDYLRPSYDNMLNKTKLKFHETFKQDIQYIYSSIYNVIYIQTGLLILFLLICIYKINNFFLRVKSIICNISNFKQNDINIIYHYWCKIFLIFEKLIYKNLFIQKQQILLSSKSRKKQFNMKSINKLKQDRLYDNNNINISRQQKSIQFNKQSYRFKIKIFLLILLSILLSYIIIIIIEIKFISQFQYIIEFQYDGYSFLKYFPAATIVGYGCLEKTFSNYYPNITHFQSNSFDDVLSDLWLVGNFQYISKINQASSEYYTKRRVYFFQNPCQYNPSVAVKIGMTQSQCQSIAESSFIRGLTAFMRYAYRQSYRCIKQNYYMSAKQLDEFSKSVSLLSAYILDAITTWGRQFNKRIDSLISTYFDSNIIEVLLILCTHIIIFELIVVNQLKKQYKFYRQLYINMVPQYILINDKIIKQKFLSNKIIELN